MKAETIVHVSCLRKKYGIDRLRIEALRGLDLEIREREFLSIYDSSGAGKTTLLRAWEP